MALLPKEFYLNNDVCQVAKNLLGKKLCTNINGYFTSGIIVETEAYQAPEDKASHAYNYRKTQRNRIMYYQGGIAYIYLCYGIHHLFNVVTNNEGVPHAVLIRAIEPVDGIDIILKRKSKTKLSKNLCSGPGAMSVALGITTAFNGINLNSETIFIENKNEIDDSEIISCPRVGIDYAEEHSLWNYRFYIKNNNWVSKQSKILLL